MDCLVLGYVIDHFGEKNLEPCLIQQLHIT